MAPTCSKALYFPVRAQVVESKQAELQCSMCPAAAVVHPLGCSISTCRAHVCSGLGASAFAMRMSLHEVLCPLNQARQSFRH